MSMNYADIKTSDLFQNSISLPAYPEQTPAEMWVEAENNLEVKRFLSKWFYMMEDGTAFKQRPDPLNKKWTMIRAKLLVDELDKDFELESNRWPNLGVEAGPEYKRLTGPCLIAFAQQFDKVRKSYDQIKIEAKERLKKGEEIPDPVYLPALKFQHGYCSPGCSTPTPKFWFKEGTRFPDHKDHSKPAEEYWKEVQEKKDEENVLKEVDYQNAAQRFVPPDAGWSS